MCERVQMVFIRVRAVFARCIKRARTRLSHRNGTFLAQDWLIDGPRHGNRCAEQGASDGTAGPMRPVEVSESASDEGIFG